MKAAVVGENALEIREVPRPQPKSTEVLIKVRAIGMNRAELPGAYGSGHTRVTGSIPGIEWSGEVVECGAEVKGDARVPVLHQAPHHVGAHAAEADHSELCLLC